MPELSSRIAGFHKLGIQGRLDILKERCNLEPETVLAMLNTGNLPADTADHLIEMSLPP